MIRQQMLVGARSLVLRLLNQSQSSSNRYQTASQMSSSQAQVGASSEQFSKIKLTRVGDHLAHVELNSAKMRNAVGFPAAAELDRCFGALEEDPQVRAVVLSGDGEHFCSGVDLVNFMSVYQELKKIGDVARAAKGFRKAMEQIQAPFRRLHLFEKPLVCVLHGTCYGLGVELAQLADVRYCSADLSWAPREIVMGIAADLGSLQQLPHLVNNQSLLRELLFTGKDANAEQALQSGFVSRLLPNKEVALEAALGVATEIAARSPVGVQSAKRIMRISRDRSFLDGLDYNTVYNMSMMQGADPLKAIQGIRSKGDQVHFDQF